MDDAAQRTKAQREIDADPFVIDRLRERVERMRRCWLADAEAALAGDLGPLRTRVGLCKVSIDEIRNGGEE